MTSLRSNLRIVLALCAFAVAYFLATTVHADNGFVALAPPPGSSKLGQLYGSTSFAGFLNGLFAAAISVGAILAVLRLGYAGYQYMTSDAWGSKSHAKEVIGDVVLGLLLLLGTYLILNQINPQILNLNILQPNSINSGSGTSNQINTSGVSADEAQRTGASFNAQPQSTSYTSGAGGYSDPFINGCGVGGCGNQQDIIDTGGNPGGY